MCVLIFSSLLVCLNRICGHTNVFFNCERVVKMPPPDVAFAKENVKSPSYFFPESSFGPES